MLTYMHTHLHTQAAGAYMGLAYLVCQDLTVPIALHFFYDFLILSSVRVDTEPVRRVGLVGPSIDRSVDRSIGRLRGFVDWPAHNPANQRTHTTNTRTRTGVFPGQDSDRPTASEAVMVMAEEECGSGWDGRLLIC
jgi:hypothetical protein